MLYGQFESVEHIASICNIKVNDAKIMQRYSISIPDVILKRVQK